MEKDHLFFNFIWKSLTLLEDTLRGHQNEHNMTIENLTANQAELEKFTKNRPSLDEQYVFYQEMKGYIRDCSDCYNEKVTLIF